MRGIRRCEQAGVRVSAVSSVRAAACVWGRSVCAPPVARRLFSVPAGREGADDQGMDAFARLRHPPAHSAQAVEGSVPTGFVGPLGGTSALPFRVLRTKSGQLPVYTDYRNGRTKKLTILRKFSGDRKVLREEVWRVLGGAHDPSLEIRERAGSLEIKGDHQAELRMWLKQLGF